MTQHPIKIEGVVSELTDAIILAVAQRAVSGDSRRDYNLADACADALSFRLHGGPGALSQETWEAARRRVATAWNAWNARPPGAEAWELVGTGHTKGTRWWLLRQDTVLAEVSELCRGTWIRVTFTSSETDQPIVHAARCAAWVEDSNLAGKSTRLAHQTTDDYRGVLDVTGINALGPLARYFNGVLDDDD